MSTGRTHTATLVARQQIGPGIVELKLSRPSDFVFLPGQYMRFDMGGYQRDYTVVSAVDAQTLDFCVAVVEGGRFSHDIMAADIGGRLSVSGPHGHFVYQGGAGRSSVFAATGTGVAPYVAFCRNGVTDALLLHGVRTPGGLIYGNTLAPAMRAYVPCISRHRSTHSHPAAMFSGRVTHYLERQLKPGTYDFYLCGRRAMIRDATAIIDQRFGDSRLFIETYD